MILKYRKMLDSHQIGAVELLKEYINRIKKEDRDYNSFITVCENEATEEAKNAQKIIDSKKSSPLTGIPISVKDNICTKGIKTTAASKMLENFIPSYDAEVITRLKRQNSVIIGKTNLDEFAMGSDSDTSYFGKVNNPFDVTLSPGGSSGGSAVSTAKDFCVGALASDTGGSIIRPSAFCGVIGLKPTYGAVSRFGLISYASSLDQIGVMAKSASDISLLISAISGHDSKDMTSLRSNPDYMIKELNISSLKIGLLTNIFDYVQNNEITTHILSCADFFKTQGASVFDVTLPSLDQSYKAYYIISATEASSNLARYDGIKYGYNVSMGNSFDEQITNNRSSGFGKEVQKRILFGNSVLSEDGYRRYYVNALKTRNNIKYEYEKIFSDCDIIISPSTTTLAQSRNISSGYKTDISTVSINLAGLPVITFPCGCSLSGLPIGVSLIGRPGSEALLISLCDYYLKENKMVSERILNR